MSIQLTLLAEGFPASPLVQPGSEEAQKILDTSGQRCLTSLEQLSLGTSWAKMFTALLIGQQEWYSSKCVLTWKLKGTKYRRFYFQLRALTHPIEDTEFGSWHTIMLHTPLASDNKVKYKTKNWKGCDLTSQMNAIHGTRLPLNPRFVAEIMGYPKDWTELPFRVIEWNP